MRVVISMGGSILASPEPNAGMIKDFARLLVSLKEEGHDMMVVVGGGNHAREYISASKELGADWKLSDKIGIAVTRINAMLLCSALGKHASDEVPVDTEIDCDSGKIVIMGGVKPGQTTDAVSADLAAHCNADLLIVGTNVDGVYESDPRKDPNAKKIDSMDTVKLLDIVGVEHTPGMSAVIDPIAALIVHKNRIKTIVVDGRNLKNIENAINDMSHGGTTIIPA